MFAKSEQTFMRKEKLFVCSV